MNGSTDTTLSTSSTVPIRLASAYDTEGNVSIVDWTTSQVSDFPWMAFLKEESEMILNEEIHISGVDNTVKEYIMPIIVPDALGYYMIEESAKLIYGNDSLFHEWNKLPADLSWLYKDKPYMTSADISPVLNDLHHAIDTGEVSDTFSSYIETHTYKSPRSITAYGSYGLYFQNDMVEPHGNASTVNLKLGSEQFPNKEVIEFTKVDDSITMGSNNSTILEVIIQKRIGDYVLGQTLYITSDKILEEINLTTDPFIGTAEINTLNSTIQFKVVLSTLYNQTTQFSIWAETDTITCERSAPLTVLTSNEGILTAPTVELRTASNVLPDSVATGPLSTQVLMLDSQMIQIEPVENSIIYAEYFVSQS